MKKGVLTTNSPRLRLSYHRLHLQVCSSFPSPSTIISSVFKPGPWVLTGSPGLTPIFFINQNDIVLKKIKKDSQRVAIGFLTEYFRVNPSGQLGF